MKPIVLIATLMLAASTPEITLASVEVNSALPEPISTSPEKGQKKTTAPVTESRGQLLYENHCMECHDSMVHIRNKTKARSLNDIRKWVLHWSKYLKLDWKKTELNHITEYVNQRFYHFDTERHQLDKQNH